MEEIRKITAENTKLHTQSIEKEKESLNMYLGMS